MADSKTPEVVPDLSLIVAPRAQRALTDEEWVAVTGASKRRLCTPCLQQGVRRWATRVAANVDKLQWYECDQTHDEHGETTGCAVAWMPISEWWEQVAGHRVAEVLTARGRK